MNFINIDVNQKCSLLRVFTKRRIGHYSRVTIVTKLVISGTKWISYCIIFWSHKFLKYLPPAMKLGQGNVFRSVCQEFCPGGHAWKGGMCGRGACMVGGMCGSGRAWWGGMCGRGVHGRGACMAGRGMHGREGHAWQGACMAGSMHGRGCAWQGACVADTTRYSQWAGSTHPTGMHSCYQSNGLENKWHVYVYFLAA